MKKRMIILLSVLGVITGMCFIICGQQATIDDLKYDNGEFERMLENSKHREELLLEKIELFKSAYQILQQKKDSIDNEIINKTKERIKILKVIEKEILNINDVSIDSNLRSIANGLSEIKID